MAFWQVDLPAAAARFDESLALARALDDRPGIATTTVWLGAVRGGQGEFAEAERLLNEGLALHEAEGNEAGAAWALFNLGRAIGNLGGVTGSQDDLARAAPPLEASLQHFRALGDVRRGAMAATLLGPLLLRLDQHERAISLLREGLAALRMFGDEAYLFPGLLTLAFVAALTDQPGRAARLLGGAEMVAQMLGTTLSPVNRVTQGSVLEAIRPRLDPAALAHEQDAGRAMSLDVLMAEAWAVADDAARSSP
jgi:non-specific serine/threonine protein kinase